MSQSAEPHRAAVIAAAIATVTIAGIGLSLSATLIAVRLAEAHYSARAIGLHPAASALIGLATAPFVPWLIRHIGMRPLLIAALLLGAACLAGFALTSGYGPWLAIRGLYGVALTVMFILGELSINTAVWPARRGLVLGIYATAIAAGFAAGPLVLAAVGPTGPMPFLLAALLSITAVLPISFASANAPATATKERPPFLAILRDAPAATTAALIYGAIESSAFGLFPVFALREGFGAGAAAVATAIFALGNAVFQIPLGLATDRFGRRRLLILIAAFGALGAILLPLAAHEAYAAYVAALFIWSGIVGGLYAVGLTSLAARYADASLAQANAAYILLYSAGTLVGPPLFGACLDLATPGLFIALAFVLALFFGLALRPDPSP